MSTIDVESVREAQDEELEVMKSQVRYLNRRFLEVKEEFKQSEAALERCHQDMDVYRECLQKIRDLTC